jgi:hypothetical protein
METTGDHAFGVETVVTQANGVKVTNQVWGLTLPEAEQMAEWLNGAWLDGLNACKRDARVLYGN